MISRRQMKLNLQRGFEKRMEECSDEDLDFCCPFYHYGGNTGCDLCISEHQLGDISDANNSNMEKEWLDSDGDYSIKLHKNWYKEKEDDNLKSDEYYKEMVIVVIEKYVKNNLVSCLSADGEDGEDTVKQTLFKKVYNAVKNTFDRVFKDDELLFFPASFSDILEKEMMKELGDTCSFDLSTDDVYQQFLLWFDFEDKKGMSDEMKYYHIYLCMSDIAVARRLQQLRDDNLINNLTEQMDKNLIEEATGAIVQDEVQIVESPPGVKDVIINLISDLKRIDSSMFMELEHSTCFELPPMKGLGKSFKSHMSLRDFYIAYLNFFYRWNFEQYSISDEAKMYIKEGMKKFGVSQSQRAKWYISIYEAELPEGLLTIVDKDEDGEDCNLPFSIKLYLQWKTGDNFKEPKPLPVGTKW